MSKTTNIAARPVPAKVQEPLIKKVKSGKKPEVDVETLQKELQDKRKLLNLLEEKGIAHKIDVKAIDRALADLYDILKAKESATCAEV
jgi:hypothetical protein